MRSHALRLLRVGVALLRVDVVPRGRDLRQPRVGVVLPVAASAAFRFLPYKLMDLCGRSTDDASRPC